MPHTQPDSMPNGSPHAFRQTCLVLALNALLFFPVFFQSYKHFNTRLTPWDVGAYMDMVDKPGRFEPPFRYRILGPMLARAMRVLPGYNIEVDFTDDAAVKKDFFHFSLLNFALTALVSALLFAYLRKRLEPAYAYLGSVLYLMSFYCVVTNVIPMGDTACHLAIITGILLFEARRPWAFALAGLIGAFTKETFLIIMGLWIIVSAWENRKRLVNLANLVYLAYLAPGILAYVAATRLWPGETEFHYYNPSFLARRVFAVFNPDEYNGSFLFHVYIAQAPLLLACAVWVWSRLHSGRRRAGLVRIKGDLSRAPDGSVRNGPPFPINPELILFPFLVWLGMAMDIGNGTGRVAFMAFPALIYFEAMACRWVAAACLGNPPSLPVEEATGVQAVEGVEGSGSGVTATK